MNEEKKQKQTEFYETIGKKIKRYRKAKSWTQTDLSEKADVTQGYISDIEKGKARLNVDAFVSICNALEISTSDVLKDQEKVKPIDTKLLLAISQLDPKDRMKLFETYELIKEKAIKTPSHTIFLGHPSASASRILYHALNLD